MYRASKLKILLHLLLLSVFAWTAESIVHTVADVQESFWQALIFNVSVHEIYMRLLIIALCCTLYLLLLNNRTIKDKEAQINNILDNAIPICITNEDSEIIRANDSYWRIWGQPEKRPIKCYEHRPGDDCHTAKCALAQVLDGAKEYINESVKEFDGEEHYFILTSRPYRDAHGKVVGIIESFQDITTRKKLENENALLIADLESSLEKVKLLSGFLPICASCKMIRDDKGYWNQIESFIRDRSEAEFSHSLCPGCVKNLGFE